MNGTYALVSMNFLTEHLLLSLLITSICLIGHYHWKRRRMYFLASKFRGPPTWPIIGNALMFAGSTADIFTKIMKLADVYKPLMRIWIGPLLFIGVSRPEHAEIVLNSPHALEKSQVYRFSKPYLGGALLIADASRWKRNRNLVAQTFNQGVLNTFIPVFLEQSKLLVTSLEKFVDRGVFDVVPTLSRCTLNIICETAMGLQLNNQSSNMQYHKGVTRLMEMFVLRACQFWYHPDIICHRTKMWEEGQGLVKQLNEISRQIIAERKIEHREKKTSRPEETPNYTPRKRKAFLDHLIEKSEGGVAYTDDDILHEVNGLLVGGSDTTTASSSFALVMIGMHPKVQELVFAEVDDILGTEDRAITYEDLIQMEYLEMVIKETLRLFPVAPLIGRSITEDVSLGPCTLPKGCECVLAICVIHRDPEIWPKPLEFNPERFLPDEVAQRHPYAYIPFSGGARNCIATKFSIMSMKIILASVVRNFKISTDYEKVSDVEIKSEVVIRAVHGCRIALERRFLNNK